MASAQSFAIGATKSAPPPPRNRCGIGVSECVDDETDKDSETADDGDDDDGDEDEGIGRAHVCHVAL